MLGFTLVPVSIMLLAILQIGTSCIVDLIFFFYDHRLVNLLLFFLKTPAGLQLQPHWPLTQQHAPLFQVVRLQSISRKDGLVLA